MYYLNLLSELWDSLVAIFWEQTPGIQTFIVVILAALGMFILWVIVDEWRPISGCIFSKTGGCCLFLVVLVAGSCWGVNYLFEQFTPNQRTLLGGVLFLIVLVASYYGIKRTWEGRQEEHPPDEDEDDDDD